MTMAFWKLVVRIENGSAKATEFLASQAELLSVPKTGAEALHPPDVHEFLASISHIAELTGLKLDKLARYDTYQAPKSRPGPEALKAKITPITAWERCHLVLVRDRLATVGPRGIDPRRTSSASSASRSRR